MASEKDMDLVQTIQEGLQKFSSGNMTAEGITDFIKDKFPTISEGQDNTQLTENIQKGLQQLSNAGISTKAVSSFIKDKAILLKQGSEKKEDYMDKIQELKKNLNDLDLTNITDDQLFYWLRSAEFNLKKVEKHIHSTFNLHKLLEIGQRTEESRKIVERIRKYDFGTFLGFDKNDYPVMLYSIKDFDASGYIQSMTLYDLCILRGLMIEKMKKLQDEHQKKTGIQKEFGLTYIIDANNLKNIKALDRPVADYFMSLGTLIMDVFPQMQVLVRQTIILNAGHPFLNMYAKSPLSSWSTLLAGKVIKCDSTEILNYVDAEILPEYLGGTKVGKDGDVFCSDSIRHGQTVPETIFVRNNMALPLCDSDVHEIVLKEKEVKFEFIDVKQAGSKLHIQFYSTGGVNFGISYLSPNQNQFKTKSTKEVDNESERLSPIVTMHADVTPLDNVINCFKPGTYALRFDNDFDLAASVRAVYRTKLYPPGVRVEKDDEELD